MSVVNELSVFEPLKFNCMDLFGSSLFSLPGQSPGKAIVLPPALAFAKC